MPILCHIAAMPRHYAPIMAPGVAGAPPGMAPQFWQQPVAGTSATSGPSTAGSAASGRQDDTALSSCFGLQ